MRESHPNYLRRARRVSEISQGSGQRVEGRCLHEEQLPGAAQLAATRTKKDRRIFLSDDELLGGERADPRARRDGAACAQSACSACRAGCSRRCATRSTRCRSSRAPRTAAPRYPPDISGRPDIGISYPPPDITNISRIFAYLANIPFIYTFRIICLDIQQIFL